MSLTANGVGGIVEINKVLMELSKMGISPPAIYCAHDIAREMLVKTRLNVHVNNGFSPTDTEHFKKKIDLLLNELLDTATETIKDMGE